MPGTREGNGILARLMASIGVVPAVLLVKGAFIAAVWFLGPLVHPWALWALVVLYVGICGWNLRTIYVAAKRIRQPISQVLRGKPGEERSSIQGGGPRLSPPYDERQDI